jgi:hypothetical protein
MVRPNQEIRNILVILAAFAISICIFSITDSAFVNDTVIARSNTIWIDDGHNYERINSTSQLTNLSFEIVADKSVLKPGEVLNVSIRISNIGWEDITLTWSTGGYDDQSKIYHPNFMFIGFIVEGPTGRVYGGLRDSMLQALSWIVFEPNQTDVFNYTWDQSTYGNITSGLTTGDYTIKAVILDIEGTPAQTIVHIGVKSFDFTIVFILAVVAAIVSIVSFLMIHRMRRKH